MNNSFPCGHCSRPLLLDAGGRLPPWCRYCGADLKSPPASTPPPPTPTPPTPPSSDVTDRLPLVPARVEAPAPRIVAGQELRFFHAYNGSLGGDDLYRIYVTDYDLLVFQLGPGSVSHGQFVPRTKVRSYRGGGMIGAVAMWRESQRLSRAARVRDMLEMADEEMLRQYAGARDGGYVVGPDDVDEVRIDPPSFWGRLFGAEQEGVLRIHHRFEGKKVLALATAKDVRQAAEAATRLFGDGVRINLPWAAVGTGGLP